MNRSRHLLIALLALLVLLPSAVAVAQDDPATTLDDSAVTDDAALTGMTDSQKREFADTNIKRMRESVQRVLDLLEKTRSEERDVLKLNCINSKLSAMKGFLKVAEKANVDLEDALNNQDTDEQVHNLKLIQLSERRVQTLSEESEMCTGEESTYSGTPKVETTIDPDVRQDNPVNVDTTDVPIDPLPDVSPFQ